jgi:hypothetical protein
VNIVYFELLAVYPEGVIKAIKGNHCQEKTVGEDNGTLNIRIIPAKRYRIIFTIGEYGGSFSLAGC